MSRHSATEKAWAWLETEEIEPYRRARIEKTLTALDAELTAIDRARARAPFPPQCETLASEPKFAEGWTDPENPERLS